MKKNSHKPCLTPIPHKSTSNATTEKTNHPMISEDEKRPRAESSLSKMPCVSTIGLASNGKQLVDSCTAIAEMRLVLFVCHGTFLSPTEFVQHLG